MLYTVSYSRTKNNCKQFCYTKQIGDRVNGVLHRRALDDLSGRVAFVTGGSSGIGLGIARACFEAGMKVIVTYLTDSHLEDANSYFAGSADRFHAIKVDVRDRVGLQGAAAEVVDRFGPVHLVCANAGVGITIQVSQAGPDDWKDAIDVNVMGVVKTVAAFLPGMLARPTEPSHIVATSSMSGLFHGASAGVYTTTKYAVVGMMEALRAELSAQGIGVSAFCPGLVQSRIFQQYRHRPGVERGANGESEALHERRIRAMAAGMDPLECGRKVLRGVCRNDLYILTHPEFREGFNDRVQAVMHAFDGSEDDAVPQARVAAERVVLRHPVYAAAIDA